MRISPLIIPLVLFAAAELSATELPAADISTPGISAPEPRASVPMAEPAATPSSIDSTGTEPRPSSERRREARPDFGVWVGASYGVNNLSLDLTGRWRWIALNVGAGNILHAWTPNEEIVRRQTDDPTVAERFQGHVFYAHLVLIQEITRGILVYAGAGIGWRNETEVQRSLLTGLYHEPRRAVPMGRWASAMAGLEMRFGPSFSVGAGYGVTQGWGVHVGYYVDWFGETKER